MKKIILLAVLAVIVVGFSGCRVCTGTPMTFREVDRQYDELGFWKHPRLGLERMAGVPFVGWWIFYPILGETKFTEYESVLMLKGSDTESETQRIIFGSIYAH